MSTKRFTHRLTHLPILLGAVFLFVAAVATAGTNRTELLDRNGNLYQIRATTYGAIDATGTAAAVDTPVLSLDVVRPDGSIDHQIVPDSLGWKDDTEGRLFLDPGTGNVYVLWIAKGDGSDEVRVASYHDHGGWLQSLQVSSGDSAARTGLDTLYQAVTAPTDVNNFGTTPRNVIHAVWWESPGGARYAPILLRVDGTIDVGSLATYAPTANAGDESTASCWDTIPGAALSPTVTRESITSSHLAVFSPEACRFLIVPVSQFNSVTTYDDDGNPLQTRLIPFIGLSFGITAELSMIPFDGDSHFDPSTGGSVLTGYAAVLSWTNRWTETVTNENDGTETEVEHVDLAYQLFDPSSGWTEIRKIPITDTLSLDTARQLVQQLLDSR